MLAEMGDFLLFISFFFFFFGPECMDVYFKKCITCILNHSRTRLSRNGRCASTGSNEEKKNNEKKEWKENQPIRLTV